jgi:hypothetical protein
MGERAPRRARPQRLSAEVDRAGRALVVITAPPAHRRYEIRVQARVKRFEGVSLDERILLELPPGRAPPQGAIIDALAVVLQVDAELAKFDDR